MAKLKRIELLERRLELLKAREAVLLELLKVREEILRKLMEGVEKDDRTGG